MITIVDYGMGNLGSIVNMISRVGGRTRIVDRLKDLADADKIILPGVGSFDVGMQHLEQREMMVEPPVPHNFYASDRRLYESLRWIYLRFKRRTASP
jgi:hypothetical protein